MPWLDSIEDIAGLDVDINKVIAHDFHVSRHPEKSTMWRWWCKCGRAGHWHNISEYPQALLEIRWVEHCKNQWKRKKKV